VLDLNEEMQVGEGANSTAEHGVILTASLADQGLRAGRSVGLVANSRELIWRPPQAGDHQRQRILRDLALVETGAQSLEHLLAHSPASFGRLASLVLITPDTGGDWIGPLFTLARRGLVPTILLLDPSSFNPEVTVGSAGDKLSRLGIAHTVIGQDLLDRPEARPGRQGQWEWRTLATGRAVPVRPLPDTDWEALPE
jgi:uncharacterized protein (DUF58 family)